MDNYYTDIFYKANPNVSTRLIGDSEAVLYDPDTGKEKFVNLSGLFIWQRLDGSFSTREIADKMCEAFASAPNGQVLDDAKGFLGVLAEQGFVSKHSDRLSSLGGTTEYPDIDDSPQTLDTSLTGKCNLHCQYCFYAGAMQLRQDLLNGYHMSSRN